MKTLLIDVMNVVLIRDEKQNYGLDAEVLELLERLLKEGVPIYAVSMVSQDQWNMLEYQFPTLKSLFRGVAFPAGKSENAKDRVDAIRHFLKKHGVPEDRVFYIFDSSFLAGGKVQEYYDAFREDSDIGVNFHNSKMFSPYWLKKSFVAKRVMYHSARSPEILLNSSEKELCGLLVKYIALAMCRQFLEWDFEDWIELLPEKASSHNWDQVDQYDGVLGAMMTTDGISTYKIVITCLEQFGLVERVGGRVYQLLENAHDIPQIIRTRHDINREQFAWAVETFFDYEVQSTWSPSKECREKFPERIVNVSSEIIDGFLATELITEKDGRLVWSDKMEPFFMMMQRGGPVVRGSALEKSGKEEASEFFARICMLPDEPLH